MTHSRSGLFQVSSLVSCLSSSLFSHHHLTPLAIHSVSSHATGQLSFKGRFLLELEEVISIIVVVEVTVRKKRGRDIITGNKRLLRLLRVYQHVVNRWYLLPRDAPQKRPINKFAIDLNPLPAENELQPWLNELNFINA